MMKVASVASGLAVLLATATSVESLALLVGDRSPSSNDQALLGSGSTASELTLDSPRLVRLSENPDDTQWMSEREKLALRTQGVYLVDITDNAHASTASLSATRKTYEYPTPNSSYIDSLLPHLSKENMESNLLKLTSLHTRYYNSETGLKASQILYETLLNYAEDYGMEGEKGAMRDVTIMPFHHRFKQYSIVVSIKKAKASPTDPITIVGAHIDSLNRTDPYGRAPGADDDGSGTVTILEACRVLLQSGYIPETPIEFHFYAGEEGGLLGSQAISAYYANRTDPPVDVKGMLQLDMTAWIKNGTGNGHVGITTTRSKPLADFNRKLVERYLSIPWINESEYPLGASDSNSWQEHGWPSSDCLEATWDEMRSRPIHGLNDHQYHPEFSFDHMLEYAKLAVAFMVELGGQA